MRHLERKSFFPTGDAERTGSKKLELSGAFLKLPRERLPENEASGEENRAGAESCRTES